MKSMKKAVGKKPMMKAKKGMSVKDPGDGIKGADTKRGNILKGVGAAIATGIGAAGLAINRRKKKRDEELKRIKKTEDQETPKAKYGATVKSKSAKPKAMYGKTMKPGMMKKGGAKK